MQIAPLPTLLLVVVVLSNATASTALSIANSGQVTLVGRWFDYVVVIMLENHSINYTYYNGGSVNPCLGNCTYFTSLANANGLAEGLTIDSIQGVSVGSYIAITSGYTNTNITSCNNGPNTSGCPPLQVPDIVDSLENAHLTWKAYMEDYPLSSGCAPDAFKGRYSGDHNPFVYYADIWYNTTRCSHIVKANSQIVTQNNCWPTPLPYDDVLINDLNNIASAPNYMFLTPNSVDDTHDCTTNDVSAGNAWMNNMIPQILGSSVFKTRRAAIFVTFDEPDCKFSGCPPAAPDLYSVWASSPLSPTTKSGFKSSNSYTLYSPLRAIEDNWNLPQFYASTDGGANGMHEFFLAT
jgi:phosphoesterase family protein